MSVRNWSQLPDEALRNISLRLTSIKAFTRFGGVCQSWRSVVLHKLRFSSILKPLPWLMLTGPNDTDGRSFFSPLENKIRSLHLPTARGCRCWDSPSGWLVTLGLDENFHLLNAFSQSRIPLPPLSTFPDHNLVRNKPGYSTSTYIFRAIVLIPDSYSTNRDQHHHNKFIVFAIYGEYRRLAFARPGDTAWTRVSFPCLSFQSDVILIKDDIYSIDTDGRTWRCDISGSNPMAKKFMEPPIGLDSCHIFALIEVGRELHMGVRILNFEPRDGKGSKQGYEIESALAKMYRLSTTNGLFWTKLISLGKYSIFVGSNTIVSVIASDYPSCKAGCIYYTEKSTGTHGRFVGEDMGMFNLETEELEPLFPGFKL